MAGAAIAKEFSLSEPELYWNCGGCGVRIGWFYPRRGLRVPRLTLAHLVEEPAA